MRPLTWLFQRTLNSVPFGIAILAAIAIYIAIGSGWVGLRERLEMDELLFFNWWPFKVLIALLVMNLTVVTVVRIPLTPPRYGVWSIHMGIILLVMSLSAYYSLKREGLVPLVRGNTTRYYYDRWDRALFVRTQFSTGMGIPLDGLPRFHEYDASLGNDRVMDRTAFRNLKPKVYTLDNSGRSTELNDLGTALGLSQPVTLDVVSYFPFAMAERYRVDPAAHDTALRVRVGEHAEGETLPTDSGTWLVGGQPNDSIIPLGPAVLEHRHLPTQADVDLATNAAKRLHKLSIRVGDRTEDRFVEPGETLDVAGYQITIEGFTPQFELSDGSGRADMLTVHVARGDQPATQPTSRPAMLTAATQPASTQPAPREYRRTILSGSNVQTDFELGVAGAGPFGKRKRDGLLDNNLQLAYTFSDPTKLLPTMEQVTVKYLLFTAGDTSGVTLLRVSSRDSSTTIRNPDNHVNLHVTAPTPMLAGGDEQDILRVNIERLDHVAPSSAIVAIPKEKRNREAAREGDGQMVKVRVRCGDWSQDVAVPYAPFAVENTWPSSPKIHVPGANGEFQLCLGNVRLPMERWVRLEKFEPVPYAGGDTNRPGVMRDFRSTITLIDPRSGDIETQTTSLNNPAFFTVPTGMLLPGQSWLLSQASWNPQDHDQTTLQIGNRPGVGMMIFACVMIFGGLLYAFYAKPLIIRRMKANALRRAMEKRQRQEIPEAVEEPAGAMAPVVGREA